MKHSRTKCIGARAEDLLCTARKDDIKIAKDTVVAFEYVMTDDKGRMLDKTERDETIEYIHGGGQILPALEKVLEGKRKGERLLVKVPPKDGYGDKRPESPAEGKGFLRVARSKMVMEGRVSPGIEIEVIGSDKKSYAGYIYDTDEHFVTIGRDHPLAGITLYFDLRVRGVCAATRQELSEAGLGGRKALQTKRKIRKAVRKRKR